MACTRNIVRYIAPSANRSISQPTINSPSGDYPRQKRSKINGGRSLRWWTATIYFWRRAKEFCVLNGVLLQALYEVAVTHYLDLVGTHQKHLLAIHHDAQVGTQLPVKVGSLVPHDDLMIFKT